MSSELPVTKSPCPTCPFRTDVRYTPEMIVLRNLGWLYLGLPHTCHCTTPARDGGKADPDSTPVFCAGYLLLAEAEGLPLPGLPPGATCEAMGVSAKAAPVYASAADYRTRAVCRTVDDWVVPGFPVEAESDREAAAKYLTLNAVDRREHHPALVFHLPPPTDTL